MDTLQILKPRILVIDDDAFMGALLRRVFEQTGRYSIESQTDPLAAVATARLFQPNLLIVDISMPRRNGLLVAADFRREPVLKDCPIIFFSGAAIPDLECLNGTGQAPIEFLRKSTSLAQLIEAADRLLGVEGGEQFAVA